MRPVQMAVPNLFRHRNIERLAFIINRLLSIYPVIFQASQPFRKQIKSFGLAGWPASEVL